MSEPVDMLAEGGDGSMETILASIRRIIREDEAAAVPAAGPDADEDDLLVLQPSMMVQPPARGEDAMPTDTLPADACAAAELASALFDDPALAVPPSPEPVLSPAPEPGPVPALLPAPPPAPLAVREPALVPLPTHSLTALGEEPLLAPTAHAVAAHALSSLQDAVRPAAAPPAELRLLRSGGPTIEDMVREELRGQLKLWLDANLPPLVERLVHQEIQRLSQPA